MTESVAGRHLSGSTSRAAEARMSVEDGEFVVRDETGAELTRARIRDTEVSPRLGRTPRRLRFPDQSGFETEANDSIDAWLRSAGRSSGIAHRLEGKLRFILPALIVAILATWGFLTVGLPFMAGIVAHRLPEDILDGASESTLATLDKLALEPTKLAPDRRNEITTLIRRTFPTRKGAAYEVLFRRGGLLGANAFALPDGSVVFTDELVELLETDEEILAVFAHELGHVVERHALRQLLQTTAVAVVSYLVVGEATDGLLEAINALPALLMNSAYSREFESEADDYAIWLLQEAGISPRHLGKALRRLTHDHGGEEGLNYLSSHPPTEERIRKTEQAEP